MAFSLPIEAQQRLQARIERVSPDLFKMLDEVREFGGTYLSLKLRRPGVDGEQEMRVVLADPQVSVNEERTPAPAVPGS